MIPLFLAIASATSHLGQADIQVPFRIGETAIIVEAKVNGRAVSLMFDTGFSGAVDVDQAVDIGKATGKMPLRDFVRETEANTVHITSLQLGDMKVDATGLDAVQLPGQEFSYAFGTHCDGLMGFEVIKSFVTEINFQQNKFIFHPASYDVTGRMPDNSKTFLQKLLPIGNDSLEMNAELPDGKSMILALDTGNSFFLTTHKDVLERVGLWNSDRVAKYTNLSGVASGTVENFSFRVPSVKIFGMPVERSVWDVIDLPASDAEADGTVGFQFLRNFNITIDYARRRIWFENWTGKFTNDERGDVGISAGYVPSQKAIKVLRVTPGSPADNSGIKEGDEVVSLDSSELGRFGIRKMRGLLEGKIGTKVRISIVRNGLMKRYELERQALVNE